MIRKFKNKLVKWMLLQSLRLRGNPEWLRNRVRRRSKTWHRYQANLERNLSTGALRLGQAMLNALPAALDEFGRHCMWIGIDPYYDDSLCDLFEGEMLDYILEKGLP